MCWVGGAAAGRVMAGTGSDKISILLKGVSQRTKVTQDIKFYRINPYKRPCIRPLFQN